MGFALYFLSPDKLIKEQFYILVKPMWWSEYISQDVSRGIRPKICRTRRTYENEREKNERVLPGHALLARCPHACRFSHFYFSSIPGLGYFACLSASYFIILRLKSRVPAE